MSSDQPASTTVDARPGDSSTARDRSSRRPERPGTGRDRSSRGPDTAIDGRGSVAACLRGGRGVSYALGFVVVFSVVLAGTLALFVAGVDMLSDADRDGAVAASEANVDVLHSEVSDMVTQGDRRRALRLELTDTTVRFTGSEAAEIHVESDDAALGDIGYGTRALRYELPAHDTTFVYVFGHVYRVDERGDASALSEHPPVFEVSDTQTRLVVPVLTGPTADSPTTVGVSGTSERELVAVRSGPRASLTRTGTESTNTSAAAVGSISGTVTIEGTEHPSVWVTALDATGFDDVQVTGDGTAVTGQFETDRLTVQRADIAFALGGERAS